ncbi:hypothetical protein [Micromonospora sp. CA-244673]|uniref:hypothetical protein n=1 Tax=Micromonospora sp. CA-244673 TaxID=3239958 RepID=UPI003D8E1208
MTTVTAKVINPSTRPGVIVPSRERPVAERTMCDDGNDAPWQPEYSRPRWLWRA